MTTLLKLYASPLVFALLVWMFCGSAEAQIANPLACENAKAVLRYLQSLNGLEENRLLVGQDLGHGNNISRNYPRYVARLQENTGRTLGLIGGDYGLDSSHDVEATNQIFIEHWNRGGLVQISWHIDNPWTGGNSWDTTRQEKLDELIDGALSAKWIDQLNQIADALDPLQQQGVPVLFRPLHEANGDWFWWGQKQQPGHEVAYKRLFRHMYDYMTHERGLDNLIWVYSAAVTYRESVVDYYPGPECVDVVGLDIYDDRVRGRDMDLLGNLYPGGHRSHIDDLIALGSEYGHPVGITEFGRTMGLATDGQYNYRRLTIALEKRPEIVFSLSWHNYDHLGFQRHAIIGNRGQIGLMNDPLTATLRHVELDYGFEGVRFRNVGSGRHLSTVSTEYNKVVNTFRGLEQSVAKTRWVLEPTVEGDGYRLRNAFKGSASEPNYLHNLARVRAKPQTVSSRQVWILERIGDNYRLKSKYDGLYLSDSDGGRVRSTVDIPDSALQQWLIEPIK
jgi:mannan endo-1,4-beta-mannosidase